MAAPMDLGLKGKKAIVTGGTRGIGHAVASLLAAEGCDIAICARSKGPLDETVAALARHGVRATGGAVDVADLPALRGWIADAADALGGLDIFVANVSALAQGMDEGSWRRGFEIDVMATVFGIEAALHSIERAKPPRATPSAGISSSPWNKRASKPPVPVVSMRLWIPVTVWLPVSWSGAGTRRSPQWLDSKRSCPRGPRPLPRP
jgi:NAD(P)-dependent dehydrogenase (short-subunit alcohol dehydrogenase family)